jgi:hypothetical protein
LALKPSFWISFCRGWCNIRLKTATALKVITIPRIAAPIAAIVFRIAQGLLNSREKEIAEWEKCEGTSVHVRDWLLRAKTRVQSIVDLCKEHNIEDYLHTSKITPTIRSKFTPKMEEDFQEHMRKRIDSQGVFPRQAIMDELVKFIDNKIRVATNNVNLEMVDETTATLRKEGGTKSKDEHQPKRGGQSKHAHAAQQSRQDGSSAKKSGPGKQKTQGPKSAGQDGTKVNPKLCVTCGLEHPSMFYCSEFIAAAVDDRYEMVKEQQSCSRCLTMGIKFTQRKNEWWPKHEQYCRTKFACNEGKCVNRPKDKQCHITIC